MSLLRHWMYGVAGLCASLGIAGAAGAADTLLEAAANGNPTRVGVLLAQGADVDQRDSRNNTPLLLATAGGHVAAARRLIDAGADVNASNWMHDSPYLLAGAEGQLQILEMTLAHGADLKSTNRYGGTALIPACERGHVEVVARLLAAGVAPDHVNSLGWTGLLEAILLSDGGPRHQAIVQLLIDAGADVNLADRQGVTPLQHARERGQQRIVELLLAHDAH
ncbi:ankyrin repeat domain-containing protein [Pseudomonas palmensis]|uniref:ankyrin repeat domain-containing protein n=1 Tax=Pseudomonas palmensis TaxID=2815362 RepID=UPI0038B4C69E